MTQVNRLGIIGFGQVGQAIAGVLAKSYRVGVYDLSRDRAGEHPLVKGREIELASSAADLASSADMLLLCLPTPEASQVVAAEIQNAIRPGLAVLETSTVAPENILELRAALEPQGARVVDTAVIGGIHALSKGEAVFLIGASEGEAGPFAEVIGNLAAEIYYFGSLGGGMRAKLIANAVSHAVYVVLAETMAVAAAQDIPLDVLYRLLARESGMIRPLTHRIGERLFNGDFSGGMSTANARKDSRLFLDAAHRLGVPVFATQAAHSIFEVAAREGMCSPDYAIVATLWEKWAGVSFAVEKGE